MFKTKTVYGLLLALCFAAVSMSACKGKEEKKEAEPKMEQPSQPQEDTANKADERPTKEGD